MNGRLTYCTNIHPGESWAEVRANLERFAVAVKREVSPGAPFPLGLRLSNRAAVELGPREAAEFAAWCRELGFFVATLNGFPYGTFHGTPVKEQVYLPDWRDPERLAYTQRLAALLAQWLPTGRRGSISTVPLGFRRGFPPEDRPAALKALRRALEYLARVAQATGKEILLSVEPEPGCLIETTEEAAAFVTEAPLPEELRRHLAVCYDCCHQALQFEDPARSLGRLAAAGVRVGHVQVSSALRILGGSLASCAPFCEPCYLHQSVGRTGDGTLVRYDDLPEAMAEAPEGVDEWRVHFHVPVFAAEARGCSTTRSFLEDVLPLFAPETPLEVETYTWSVLPPELRAGPVTESIAREIRWVEGAVRGKS